MIIAGEYSDEGKSGKSVEGRRQKARECKWNGGFAPYGYQLINGELHIAEDEVEIIRIIYDKFVNTTMGIIIYFFAFFAIMEYRILKRCI